METWVGALASLAVAFAVTGHAQTPVPKISAEDFGALPFMTGPKLSPDGTRVLARTYTAGQRAVVVVELGRTSKRTTGIPIPDTFDLMWYRWAGNNRILFSLGRAGKYRDEDIYSTRLMMYDLATSKPGFIGKRYEGFDGDDVIYVAPDGKSLLLSLQRNIYEYPSVWDVDLDTLGMKEIVRPRDSVWDWFADSSGVVRAGMGTAGRRWWLLYRKDGEGRFEKVLQRRLTDSRDDDEGDIDRFIVIGGSDEGYAIASGATGRYGLYRYNFATDTLGEPVFTHPVVDIDDYYQSENGEIQAVYYTDDRSRIEWLNPQMKELQSNLDKALPDQINRVLSISRDGGTMIVYSAGSADPGRYYVYVIPTGKMFLLARPYERLSDKKLAPMQSASYRARDGLEIPAYVTFPLGREQKNLPLIVMPHGGPFIRDEWAYDPWVQFLANRGYAVLQPNYRGSTGYGKVFVEKGMGQWGRAMQDDLDDGVKWLVEQGKVDPKRVCMMGASYGGYAAMWAAARNADLYRCAISFAGISDVGGMLKYDRRTFSAPRYFRDWRERVQGEKDFDLSTISPLHAVERITIPLLIAHGDKDENVPLAQSRRLHEALTKAGRPHEYIVYPGERHGLEKVANSVDFLNRIEAFLSKHNAAD